MFATNITIEKKELEYIENLRKKFEKMFRMRCTPGKLESYKVFTTIKKKQPIILYFLKHFSWFSLRFNRQDQQFPGIKFLRLPKSCRNPQTLSWWML